MKGHAVRLSIPSDPACLRLVRGLVEGAVQMVGFDEPQVSRIILAVDEACTNIIRHQYGGRHDQRIDLDAAIDTEGGRVEFLLRDYGERRDPEKFCGRDLNDVRPGGLGVRIIREVMDTVEYSSAPDVGMQLRLVKSTGGK